MNLIDVIKEGLKRKGMSERQASIKATGYEGTIKNLKAGHPPSFDKVEKLFEVLGINLTYSLEDDLPSASDKVPLLGHIAAGGDDYPQDTSISFFPDNSSTDEVAHPATP
ncbi:MAG: helix-turn-helix transcriptional regulator, partial [Ahrensia sp.]|nr:helix-turn-helix transcriptional regulator [Ahrensia sp.]